MSKKILIFAMMMVFVTAGFAAAQPCGKGPWHDRDWRQMIFYLFNILEFDLIEENRKAETLLA